MTIKQLFDEHQKKNKKRESIREEITRLEKKLVKHEQDAETAADTGNVEEYKKHQNSINNVKQELFVYGKQLENLSAPVDKDIVVDAWEDYLEPVTKEFRKGLDEYNKIRHKLFEQYTLLAGIRAKAKQARATCGEIAGISGITDRFGYRNSVFKICMDEGINAPAEQQYFIRTGELSLDDSTQYARMFSDYMD